MLKFRAFWSLLKSPVFHWKMLVQWSWGILLALTGQVCWKKSFQPPISGPFFPFDPTCSGCSGLFGLRGFISSLLGLTLDSPCHARNIKKLCFHSSNCFSFNSHLSKISYCWNLDLIWNKKQFHPFPILAAVLKMRDFCKMEILVWCLSFHKTPGNSTEQRRQQASTAAVVWTLDWQRIPRGWGALRSC